MGHASLVIGHLFTGTELVEAVPVSVLEVLNPKSLEDYLRKETKYLDVEWFSRHVVYLDSNLRKKEKVAQLFFDQLLKEERYLVGHCVADSEENHSILKVRGAARSPDNQLIETVLGEFKNVFIGRSWEKNDLFEHLVSPLYSRSTNGRRTDYPIIGVENKG